MAKQTSDIFIRLGIENLEGIDKLKSAFRELDKTLGVSNTTITTARQRINEYIAGTTRSEQAINGQLAALRGLRSQVDINGRGYQELTTEIAQLQGELRGSTDAVDRQREALLRSAGAGKQNAEALQRQITTLERLRQQTRPGSSAFLQLGQDIEKATASLGRFRSEVSQAASTVTQIPGSTFEKIANQVGILQRRMQTLNFTSADFLRYQERINLVNLVQSTIVGRQQVRANATLYASPQYTQFVGARAEKTPLPSTPAGYQQRIGEIQAELENITNLERRRELTIELDGLNRRLAGTVSTVVTAEQRAVDAVRARVNAQRELLSQSGFGAFSAGLSGRSFKAEQQAETVAAVNAASAAMEEAYVTRIEAARAGIRRNTELEVQQIRLLDEEDEKAHQATMQRMADEAAAGTKWFNEQMAMDKVTRRRNLMSQALGMGQRDLSPFYQRVVGLGSAGVERQQMFMGKSPTDVYNDIVKSFRMGERTDLLSGVRDAATNVTDTFSDGLEQGSPKAKSAAEKLAEAAKAGIKRAFGIASPSKFIISVVQTLVKTWEDELKSASPRLQLAAERAFGLSGPRRMASRFVNTIEGKQIVPATNYRALPVRSLDVSTQGPEMDAMMRRYRQQIAALTSQPAIYENLLNALPSSRLTTNLVGLANQRMGMIAQYPDYLPGLRRIEARGGPLPRQTPGVDIFDLENEIKRLASSYFREIRVPNPWIGAIGDYKKFIDAIEFDTKQLRTQALLSGTRIAGALPPVAESISGFRQQRIAEAYRRSSERGLRVLAADAFADQGSLALPPANYGFAADPARLNRLMARARRGRLALPPAIDIQATPVVEEAAVAAESTSLRATVKDFFARLRTGVGSAFGGGGPGGRPPTPPMGAGGVAPGGLDPEITKLKSTLLDFGPIAQRSTRDLQELRSVLQEQAAGIAPGAAGSAMRREYDAVLKTIEQQDKRLEREIERRNRSRQRLGGRQIAQIGGAAISGGIFGGPEGFLGGVIGGAVGGVGGSFAGAAAGAQLGMLRQQLGQTSAYAAEIGKMQIALRGVSGSQENYNKAIAAAASVTRELNVPQREATAGITRLSAAVLGAGGTIDDATFGFRAITEAIKATGGNAEQVDGALLALTQVFSKGKVSAEELNQIAERLPGTFTLFAQATGKTGPELQKALQQGTVGLNDLMKFLELASAKHGQTALKIAASNDEAGARLKITYDKLSLDIGRALAPIGAEIQNTFAAFITELAPSIVDSNGNIGTSFIILVDPIERVIDLFKELGKTKSDLQPLFEFIAYNVKALTAAFYINNLVLEATIKKAATSAAAVAALAKGDFAAMQRITLQSIKSDQAAFASVPQVMESIWNPRQTPGLADIRGTGRQVQGPRGASFRPPSPTGTQDAEAKAKAKADKKDLDTLRGILDVEEAVFKAGQALQLSRYELRKKLTDMETQNRLAALGTIERETAQALEDRRAKTVQFAEEQRALEDKQLEAARALRSAQRLAAKGGDAGAVSEAQTNLNLVTKQLNDLTASQERYNKAADRAAVIALTESMKSRNEELQKTIRLETLRADLQQRGYSSAQVQLQLDLATAEDERMRRLTGVTELDQITKINAGYAEMAANLQKIYDLNQANANTFGFREGAQRYVESIGTMREATASLTEQGFKGLEDVIFQLTTTGTANFQQFAASILQQTARMIIQQLILKTIMQALGAIGGGGGGADRSFATLMTGVNKYSANGNVFAANGIVPYAMGGIVTRPTLFPFANGGSIGTGLMGEAGPEAIIPLQRGANGKLGVAGGGGTTNIVINVDASGGTSVSGDEAQAKQLGQAVTVAVQAELLKHKRPGGLLSR